MAYIRDEERRSQKTRGQGVDSLSRSTIKWWNRQRELDEQYDREHGLSPLARVAADEKAAPGVNIQLEKPGETEESLAPPLSTPEIEAPQPIDETEANANEAYKRLGSAMGNNKVAVPRFALNSDAIIKRLNELSPGEDHSTGIPEITKPEIIPAEKPEFPENYGKTNPASAWLRAGLATLATPAGLTGLQAIGQGGLQGLEAYDKDRLRAAAEQREMRQENRGFRDEQRGNATIERQYQQDLLSRAKTIADIKISDAKIDNERKDSILKAMQLAQQGSYQQAYLEIQSAEMAVRYPQYLRDPVRGLQDARALMKSQDPEKQQLGQDLYRLLMYKSDQALATSQNAQTRQAAQIAQKIVDNPTAYSPEEQQWAKDFLKSQVMRSMSPGGGGSGPTSLPNFKPPGAQ